MDKTLSDRVKDVVNQRDDIRLSPAVLQAVTAWEAYGLAEQRGRVPRVVARELNDRWSDAEGRMSEAEFVWWQYYQMDGL